MIIPPGTTSKRIRFTCLDADGNGVTGESNSTLTLNYLRDGAAATVPISLSSGTLGTWASGAISAVGNGVYEIGLPDAMLASGVTEVELFGSSSTTGVSVIPQTIILKADWATLNQGTEIYNDTVSLTDDWGDGGRLDVILDANATSLTTLTSRLTAARAGYLDNLQYITSTLFSGITSFAEWIGLLAGKQTGNSTARSELRATGAGSGTFDETTDSLEAVRDRGDAEWAGGSATLIAVSTTVSSGVVSTTPITAYYLEGKSLVFTVVDEDGDAIDLSGDTIKFVVEAETSSGNYVDIFVDTGVVGGASNNVVTVTIASTDNDELGDFIYSLRNETDDDQVLARGEYKVVYAALADS